MTAPASHFTVQVQMGSGSGSLPVQPDMSAAQTGQSGFFVVSVHFTSQKQAGAGSGSRALPAQFKYPSSPARQTGQNAFLLAELHFVSQILVALSAGALFSETPTVGPVSAAA